MTGPSSQSTGPDTTHGHRRRDRVTGMVTTGHEWDGVEELDTPPPLGLRLWLAISTVIAIMIVVLLPAIPIPGGNTAGLLGYTEAERLARSLARDEAKVAEWRAYLAATPITAIAADAPARERAILGGRSAYRLNCMVCHGLGGEGGNGFPNLTDKDWLWGGSPEAIEQTLVVGINAAHPETRQALMPAFGRDGTLNRDQILDVIEHVRHISGQEAAAARRERGAVVFAETCAACHGEQGEGNRDLGAPTLKDGIWLYGGSREVLYTTLMQGRGGVMPHWSARLDTGTIREVALYVHSLGGGEPSP